MTSLGLIHISCTLSLSRGHQIKYGLQHLQLVTINSDLLNILTINFLELKKNVLSKKMGKGVTITCMKKLWFLENTIHGGYKSQGPNFIWEVNIYIFLLDLLFILFESWFIRKLLCVLFDFNFSFCWCAWIYFFGQCMCRYNQLDKHLCIRAMQWIMNGELKYGYLLKYKEAFSEKKVAFENI
jgi:hypothetical protein